MERNEGLGCVPVKGASVWVKDGVSQKGNAYKYFEIVVDANCPNDYLVNFNIRFTYENGMDENQASSAVRMGLGGQ